MIQRNIARSAASSRKVGLAAARSANWCLLVVIICSAAGCGHTSASPPSSAPVAPVAAAPADPRPHLPQMFAGQANAAAQDSDPLAGLLESPGAATPTRSAEEVDRAIIAEKDKLSRNPADTQTRVRLAILLDTRGDGSAAEDLIREALQRGQRDPELYHAIGMVYLHHQAFLGAAQAFFAEAQARPNDAQAHVKFATALTYGGKATEAEIEFKRAIKLDPSLADAYLGLAFLNNTSERYPYAVKYLGQYTAKSQQKGPGYGLLSRVYLNMKLYDKAVGAGEKAVQAMPNNASVWYTLGQAYSYNPVHPNQTAAAKAFEQSVRLGPTGHAHFELGNVYTRLNRTEDAANQYRETVRLEPTNGKAHYQLGQCLMRLGRRDEASPILAKAKTLIALNQRETQLLDKLSASPRNAQAQLELGQVNKQLGRLDRAAGWFQMALQTNPNLTQARNELASLQTASLPVRRE